MASLNRKATGEYIARKGIPADVREAYFRLYRVRWEERLTLDAETSKHEAKARLGEWAMWLCAYSGARAGEITQLRGIDIEQRGDFHVMKLTPDAGTIKTRQTRIVPIHDHVIEQGFLDMVREIGDGPLFYNPNKTPKVGADPLKPSRSRAATARAHLSDWVRELGVKDPEVSPTHAWRHTFKQTAARTGIAENVHDEITGHAPASEGRKYTIPTVEDMAAALKKFPRFDVAVQLGEGKQTKGGAARKGAKQKPKR